MTVKRGLACRPRWQRTLGSITALGAAGAGGAAVRLFQHPPDVWTAAGLVAVLVGLTSLRALVARVDADAHGVHVRTLWRRRSVPWQDIADLHVRLRDSRRSRDEDSRRVVLALRDGRRQPLPLPRGRGADDPHFDAEVDALRTLHSRHGTPETSHLVVVTHRTAGGGRTGSLLACLLLLALAGAAAWYVPSVAARERAWQEAVPCTAEVPAAERGECLTTLPAEIARADAGRARRQSYLYFTGGEPVERLQVSQKAAKSFEDGDDVTLTLWRGEVREVTGKRFAWHEHVPSAGDPAALAAACLLAAGYPGARLLLRLRGRRTPDDEVLPSALPFVGALAGTAVWLLPLSYSHPLTLTSPAALVWAAAGSAATLAMFAAAWRATRIRTPGKAETERQAEGREVFLAARFLEQTDYNPYHFGTHVVVGGGPPAVVPHAGPGRFAAKRIPAERLTVGEVRRTRGDDGEAVPRSWHIAELDDAGRPVRLAAPPEDLPRLLRALEAARRDGTAGRFDPRPSPASESGSP